MSVFNRGLIAQLTISAIVSNDLRVIWANIINAACLARKARAALSYYALFIAREKEAYIDDNIVQWTWDFLQRKFTSRLSAKIHWGFGRKAVSSLADASLYRALVHTFLIAETCWSAILRRRRPDCSPHTYGLFKFRLILRVRTRPHA